LRAFCETTSRVLRPSDLFGRTGGEEFACLVPDAADAEALQIAERIRAAFAACAIDIGAKLPATVSIGVASTTQTGYGLENLLAAADYALYRAKAMGRNRVESARAASVGFQASPAVA
jgi:diguanylate cyclase (GGDEF)-like protein